MTEAQATATRVMCRALGPFLIFVAVIIFARYETLTAALPTLNGDTPLLLVTGVLTLLAGCFIFAVHHHWGSAPAIAVSVLGLLFIIRGLTIALVPDLAIGLASRVAETPVTLLVLTAIAGIVGVWLTFVGWIAKP